MELNEKRVFSVGKDIPNGWEVVLLGDIFQFKNGLNKEKRYFGQGTPIVNYMDVFKNRAITLKDLNGCVTLTPTEIKNYEVKKGDVFFTRTSETIEEIGMTSVMLDDVKETVFSGFVLRGRPISSKLNIYFQKYCFSSLDVRQKIISSSSYTTRALTNGRLLSAVTMTIPSTLVEQEYIAAALTEIDSLISSIENLIIKKSAIKIATLRLLMTSKPHWQIKKFGDYIKISSGESPSKFKLTSQGIPYYKVEQLNNSSKYQFQTPYFIENCSTLIPKTSIVFPKRGGSILLNKVRILGYDSMIDTNLMALTVSEELNCEYVYYWLINIELWRIADITSIPQINNKHINPIAISIPPVQEQNQIANVLSDMDVELGELEKKLEKYQNIKQGMMQNLLTGKIRLV